MAAEKTETALAIRERAPEKSEGLEGLSAPVKSNFHDRQRETGKEAYEFASRNLKRLCGFLADQGFWALGASVNGVKFGIEQSKEGYAAAKKYFAEKKEELKLRADTRAAEKSQTAYDKAVRSTLKKIADASLEPDSKKALLAETRSRIDNMLGGFSDKLNSTSQRDRAQAYSAAVKQVEQIATAMKEQTALQLKLDEVVSGSVSATTATLKAVQTAEGISSAGKAAIRDEARSDINELRSGILRRLFGSASEDQLDRKQKIAFESAFAEELTGVLASIENDLIPAVRGQEARAARKKVA